MPSTPLITRTGKRVTHVRARRAGPRATPRSSTRSPRRMPAAARSRARRRDVVEQRVVPQVGELAVEGVAEPVGRGQPQRVQHPFVHAEPERARPLGTRGPQLPIAGGLAEAVDHDGRGRDHVLGRRAGVPRASRSRRTAPGRSARDGRGSRRRRRTPLGRSRRDDSRAPDEGSACRAPSDRTRVGRPGPRAPRACPRCRGRTSATSAFSASGICAARRARTSASSMPRATSRPICVSGSADTTITSSTSRWRPGLDQERRVEHDDVVGVGVRGHDPSATRRTTSGCTIASSSARRSGSANTIAASAARSSRPSATTSAPNAARTASKPGVPGSTTSRASASRRSRRRRAPASMRGDRGLARADAAGEPDEQHGTRNGGRAPWEPGRSRS